MQSELLVVVLLIFFLGGTVKGVIGFGLPTVSLAALTVYDMCKALDRGMRIEGIRLIHKSGGKSGTYEAS